MMSGQRQLLNRFLFPVLSSLFLGVVCMPGYADPGFVPAYIAQSVINGRALSETRGSIAVNLAAGDANQQVNAAAIVLNIENGLGAAQVGVHQSAVDSRGTVPDVSVVRIDDRAFNNATGLISINQTSGQGNAQANAIAIALGIHGQAVTETVLAQTVSAPTAQQTGEDSDRGIRRISVENTAFAGTRGLVQVNQSAGSRNATGNRFALRFQMNGTR